MKKIEQSKGMYKSLVAIGYGYQVAEWLGNVWFYGVCLRLEPRLLLSAGKNPMNWNFYGKSEVSDSDSKSFMSSTSELGLAYQKVEGCSLTIHSGSLFLLWVPGLMEWSSPPLLTQFQWRLTGFLDNLLKAIRDPRWLSGVVRLVSSEYFVLNLQNQSACASLDVTN